MNTLHLWDQKTLNAMESRFRAQLINSLPGYKTPFLVGTQNDQGQTNLAIISSITHLGSHPPLMAMIMRPNSVPRHTIENIKQTGFYTFNATPLKRIHDAHQTSARYERDRSEFDACNFTAVWEPEVQAPFVAESPLQIGLKLAQIIPLEINGCDMVIGEVLLIKAPFNLLQSDGALDIDGAAIASVSGLDCYHQSKKIVRLSYAKPDQKPREV